MAKQTINLGTGELTGDGESIRSAFDKINKNFDETYLSITVLESNAFSGSYNDLTDTPTLFDGNYDSLTNKPVLFSGSYNDLTDTPTLFDGDYNTLTNKPVLFSGSYNDLTDTPTLFDGNYNSLSNSPDLTQYVSRAEFNTGTVTIDVNNTGDLQGSVFADDSTLLVDGVNGIIPYSVLDGAPTALSNFSNDLDYGAIVATQIQTNGLPLGTEASGLFASNGQSLALGYKNSEGSAFSHIAFSEANSIQIQANVNVAAATTFDFNGATVNGTDFVESNTTGITGADQVTNIVTLTQAEYDVITPNATTVYIIVG